MAAAVKLLKLRDCMTSFEICFAEFVSMNAVVIKKKYHLKSIILLIERLSYEQVVINENYTLNPC